CRRQQADLHILNRTELSLDVRFLPLFQRRNFSLANEAIAFVLNRDGLAELSAEQVLSAAHTTIPSRMEMITYRDKTMVLDGAHNPQKLRALGESIVDYFPQQAIGVLIAFSGGRGRNLAELVAELTPFAHHVIVTSLQGHDIHMPQLEPKEIAAACRKAGVASVETISDQAQAYRTLLKRPEPVLLVTGSLYLFSQLRPSITGSATHP
ncbi:MAG: cyanophycin synthetase, partial [Patescibacteria group bacterium]